MERSTIKVLIVDDHEVVRMGLRSLLQHQEDIDTVGEAGTAAEAVSMALKTQPDVALIDIRLPDESGIEACRKIREKMPSTRVIILTAYSDEESIFASILAGASGYLLKGIETEKLLSSVKAVARGESLLDPEISKKIAARVKEISNGGSGRGLDSLNTRERQILQLISEGLTNREIADEICFSLGTVRNCVSSILAKLNVTHRTQAAVYYIERKPKED